MLKPHPTALACLASSLVLFSCAAPKAQVVAENPAPQAEKTVENAVAAETAVPAPPDDGIRLPDMLGLPGEGELRSTSPAAARPANGESGAVIARPPAQPPAEP